VKRQLIKSRKLAQRKQSNVYIRAIRNPVHLLVQVVGCCILMAF
jgi:hypothetical protein